MTSDVEKLVEMFWVGPQVMRFGAGENLYGPEEFEAFRGGHSAMNLNREVKWLGSLSLGTDFASIPLEFERFAAGGSPQTMHGRQSQDPSPFSEGWRIIQAHVSLLPPA